MTFAQAYSAARPAEVTFQATVDSPAKFFFGTRTRAEHETFVARTAQGKVDIVDNVDFARRAFRYAQGTESTCGEKWFTTPAACPSCIGRITIRPGTMRMGSFASGGWSTLSALPQCDQLGNCYKTEAPRLERLDDEARRLNVLTPIAHVRVYPLSNTQLPAIAIV